MVEWLWAMSEYLSKNSKDEYSSKTRREDISAEEISKTLDQFGSGPPYHEFQTRASRRRDDNMIDPLSVKLGEFDINNPEKMTTSGNIGGKVESNNENFYVPAVSKEILECEWNALFATVYYKNELRNRALSGRLRDCRRFRGVCWRIFLGCLPDDVGQWLDTVRESRTKYDEIKSKFLVNPYSSISDNENVQVFNPLSQDIDSPWSQYFEDNKLNELILQDLDRLFPGMHYFQSKKIKDILLHILFCYARMNPNVGYKQGMHEVLAPLVFVLEYDSEVFQFLENSKNEAMRELINPEFLEYDAFCLFDHLMEIIEPWYAQGELPPVSQQQTIDPRGVPFMETKPASPPTAIIRKLNKIQESMLKKYDGVLYTHLRDLKIEPQLYGLRWVRLLYGREFTTMEDILTLWDGLFADGSSLDLVDYIYLSLICNKRKKLLSSDHFGCLTILMKTPYCRRDAKAVVLEAKYMRDTRLDPKAKSIGAFQPKEERNSMVTIEFPTQEALQSKITSGLQTVLRGGRQVPSKKGPEVNSRNNTPTKKLEKSKERGGEDSRRHVELKSNNKSAPSSHMFPNDPNDEDLFMTSPRSRTTNATFLSKLSSKVRHPTRSDLAALQQDHERLQEQVSHFKAEVDKLQSISIYCGTKMDSYINLLQEQLTGDEQCMDVVYLSLAGLKQVRDLLKGTLSFQSSTMEQDTEFSHIDTAISSLASNTSVRTSTETELPCSLPVPLLADFGHFEKQNDEYILVESNDENKDDAEVSTNSNDKILRTSGLSENASHKDNQNIASRNVQGENETERENDVDDGTA